VADRGRADVRTVFSWSYRQLTAPAARLFRQLGTHPGPSISDAAAASLAGLVAGEVRRLLADLVRAQLLTEPSPGRYAFHDLLRAYATELGSTLDSDVDRRAAEGRMLDHYLHTANTATLVLSPSQVPIAPAPPLPATTPERPGGRQEAMEWFGAEHAVLVTLVVRAADAGLDRHAWQLADTLTVFLDLGGHWHDRVTVLTAALAAAQRLGDPWAQARTHRNLAGVFVTPGRGEEARAEEHLRRALELFGQLGDRVGQGRTHHSLGVMLLSQGKHREAIEQGQHTLTLCRAAGDQVAQAHALNLMGFGHTGLGEHELALACCERALALFEESGDRFGTAATWDSLGYAQHQRGEYVEAGNAYRRAHALFRDLGARIPGADALDRLGDTHDAAGDAPAAAATWREALAIYDELGHPAAAQVRAKLHP
jgi:tetratricopeptide (TPR) repeat protein